MNRRAIGAAGEAAAESYLRGRGAKILERNYRRLGCEIDLIARVGAALAFVEVKYRSSAAHGSPAEAVDRRKQAHICRAALAYIKEKGLSDQKLRFDVAEVTEAGVRYIEGAFYPPGGGRF